MALCACITDVTHTYEHKGGQNEGDRGDNWEDAAHLMVGWCIPISHLSLIISYTSMRCYNLCACACTYIYPVMLYMFMNVKPSERTLYVLCNWYKLS